MWAHTMLSRSPLAVLSVADIHAVFIAFDSCCCKLPSNLFFTLCSKHGAFWNIIGKVKSSPAELILNKRKEYVAEKAQ